MRNKIGSIILEGSTIQHFRKNHLPQNNEWSINLLPILFVISKSCNLQQKVDMDGRLRDQGQLDHLASLLFQVRDFNINTKKKYILEQKTHLEIFNCVISKANANFVSIDVTGEISWKKSEIQGLKKSFLINFHFHKLLQC